ncbi:amidohydrolase family protein [uncultured Dokdonia sp.]|uniref:amidohydrolase family protein n=1 Tax=uncultured Dokdonia sp. TaxID=575653 RepID=UPI00262646DD|nr:amidohydrolase family protein [uncultured Dokdonia sp.]
MKLFSTIVIIWITFLGVQAQDSFVIKEVTLFDGDTVIENTSVLVENGVVKKVGKHIKGDYEVIDGKGKFLMPALTNCHVHSFMVPQLYEAANAGVLNLLDMHGLESMQHYMTDMRDQPGTARLYRAGYAATAPGGHGTQYGFEVPTLEKPEDAKQWIADRVEAGVDHIKIIVEPWKTTISHEIAKALIEEAHANDKVAVVHISKEEDAYKVLSNGADGLVHIWTDIDMPQEHLDDLVKNKDFFVIPTILTNVLVQPLYFGKTEEETAAVEAKLLKEVKRLYDAGIPILAGTDPPNAEINMGTDLYKELIFFSKAGIPAIDVLKSATSLPATKFNIGKTGFIKEGYVADMLLLSKSPLDTIDHISSIETIWKAGTILKK